MQGYADLLGDRMLRERVRLLIVSYLASREKGEAPFTELRDVLNLTSGNLSIQLKTLCDAEYISIKKEFRHGKPFTRAILSSKGGAALRKYMEEIEKVATLLKGQASQEK